MNEFLSCFLFLFRLSQCCICTLPRLRNFTLIHHPHISFAVGEKKTVSRCGNIWARLWENGEWKLRPCVKPTDFWDLSWCVCVKDMPLSSLCVLFPDLHTASGIAQPDFCVKCVGAGPVPSITWQRAEKESGEWRTKGGAWEHFWVLGSCFWISFGSDLHHFWT